jgi:hypothetical protein
MEYKMCFFNTGFRKYCIKILGQSRIGKGGGVELMALSKQERVLSASETWRWRKMFQIKWTGRVTNGEVLQRAKKERLVK